MTMITAEEEAQKLAHKYRFANNDLERVLCETASTVIDLHQQLADAKAQRQVAATITRLSDQLAQARAACASLVEGKDAMEKCWKDARADAKIAQALVVERVAEVMDQKWFIEDSMRDAIKAEIRAIADPSGVEALAALRASCDRWKATATEGLALLKDAEAERDALRAAKGDQT